MSVAENIEAMFIAMETLFNDNKNALGLSLVNIGEAMRGKMTFPLLWVLPLPSEISDGTLALSEYWKQKIALIVVVDGKNVDAKVALKQCKLIAIKASSLLLAERSKKPQTALGGYAHDIVRTSWTPAYQNIDNNINLLGAGVDMEIRILNRE
jgi:hypothetical protein